MSGRRRFFFVLLACFGVASYLSARAASVAQPRARLLERVDESRTIPVPGNVHPLVTGAISRSIDEGTPMEHMILQLKADAKQEAALAQLIAGQADPKSPFYHHFLNAQEFGAEFGVAPADLEKVSAWLRSHGFTIEQMPAGHRAIVFSGTSGQVAYAFRTEIRRYQLAGANYYANASDPQIPSALAEVVGGVVKLHNFRHERAISKLSPLSAEQFANPQFDAGGGHYLSPADYATIYDINPLYAAGVNGAGQTIAVLARSNISIADVESFRNSFGLKPNDPKIVIANSNPGVLQGDSTETTLDTEWSGAVAPNATVKVVVAASTNTADGIDLSALYAVNNNVAPVVSLSYGSCEQAMGSSELAFYNSLWQQAAAQGMSVFVSSGDSGAAGCSGGSATSGGLRAVNGLCSSPYASCVGGTEFVEGNNPGQYWLPGNNSVYGSATAYIPEGVWNESALNGGSGLWAGGGGASVAFTKPAWQTGLGVPADGRRDVPDISLTAAGHDGYVIVQFGGMMAVGGTSASAPSFAGLMALVNQKAGLRQGLANAVLYPLAANQHAGGAAIFHDTLSGTNSVPGVNGYAAASGYDLASGLGSVDAALLVNHWADASAGGTPSLTLNASPAALTLAPGQAGQVVVKSTASAGLKAAVALSLTGAPAGVTATFSAASIAAPGSGSVNLNVMVGASAAPGNYVLTISAKGGALSATATVSLVIPASCKLAADPGSLMLPRGQTATAQISCRSAQGTFSGPLALTVAGMPSGVTAKLASASLPAGSSTALSVTSVPTVPAGTYTLSVTAAANGFSQSLSIPLTISAPSTFSLVAPASLTIAAGGSSQVTVTSTHSGAFNSAVGLGIAGLPSGITAVFSKQTLPAPGDGSAVLTFSAAASAKPGNYNLTLTGSGGSQTQTAALSLTVTAAPGFSFALNLSALTLQQGGAPGTVVVSTGNFTGGFNSTVTITFSGLAVGMNYGAKGATTGNNLVNTSIGITASKGTPAGTYPVTITASGAGISHSALVQVTVIKAAAQLKH